MIVEFIIIIVIEEFEKALVKIAAAKNEPNNTIDLTGAPDEFIDMITYNIKIGRASGRERVATPV